MLLKGIASELTWNRDRVNQILIFTDENGSRTTTVRAGIGLTPREVVGKVASLIAWANDPDNFEWEED